MLKKGETYQVSGRGVVYQSYGMDAVFVRKEVLHDSYYADKGFKPKEWYVFIHPAFLGRVRVPVEKTKIKGKNVNGSYLEIRRLVKQPHTHIVQGFIDEVMEMASDGTIENSQELVSRLNEISPAELPQIGIEGLTL